MDKVVLDKIKRFVSSILENMDADELGSHMVASDLQQEELDSFLDKPSPWIYESPDNGKTVYRRRAGEDARELIEDISGIGC